MKYCKHMCKHNVATCLNLVFMKRSFVPVRRFAVGAVDVENGALLNSHRADRGTLQASRMNLKMKIRKK